MESNPPVRRRFLHISNPNCFLFVVCLKLPDFIHVRDEKNYHKKESEVWVCEKIYAIATYYPFFSIHIQVLRRMHSIVSRILIGRVFIDNENILAWNLVKNVYDLQKNEQVAELLAYFITKKPDYGQVCFTGGCYFGTLP
jgi:hypothetical protein